MKRIFRWIIIGILLAINIVSLSPTCMKKIIEMRANSDSFFSSSRTGMGDLYGMSYLKKFGRSGWKPAFISDNCKAEKNIKLYTISDSYLNNRFTEKAFCGVNQLTQVSWDGSPLTINLDSQKTNILILETVERYACARLSNLDWMKHIKIEEPQKSKQNRADIQPILKDEKKQALEKLAQFIFNKNINQNLEFNLFDYKPFLSVWETRAELTQRLFNRLASPTVSMAANNQYLVLKETIDGKQNTASNFPVSEKDLSKMIDDLNEMRAFYLKKGFSEVYLSIIPNPVHIVDSTFKYNQLIPKIQNNTALNIPVIDIYSVFKKNNNIVFHKNETHWTNQGMQFWIDNVNYELKKIEKGKREKNL
jgi:hypothetical protein